MSNKTPLFEEAILEVNALKKAALEDAKKNLVESLTPFIKKEMEKKLNSKKLFTEANEDPMDLSQPEDPNMQSMTPPAPSSTSIAAPPGATNPALDVPMPDAGQGLSTKVDSTAMPQANATPLDPSMGAAPISPSPSSLDVPMPDANGNITINLKALFDQTPSGSDPLQGIQDASMGNNIESSIEMPAMAPGDQSMASPPIDAENPMPQLEGFKSDLNDLKKIVVESNSLNKIQQKLTENKILKLYESLEKMRTNKQINEKFAIEAEAYIDIAFNKLKEEQKNTSIYSKNSLKENKMKELRRFAMSLFEEATTGFDIKTSEKTDEGKDDKQVKGFGDHAMKASKSHIKDPGKEASLKVEATEEDMEMESLEEEIRAMFEAEEMEEEENVTEAAGAEVVGDKVSKGMKNIGGGKMNQDAARATVAEAKKAKAAAAKPDKKADKKKDLGKKLKALKEEQEKVMKALQECGMGEEVHADKVVINVGSKSDVEFVGGDEDMDIDDMSSADDVADMDDVMVDDGDMDDSSEEDDDLEVVDDESMEDDDEDEEMEATPPVRESKKVKGKALTESKKELNETKFLLAKSLYVNKLLARENLSKNQKRKIVEYLDTARSVNEAKEIYFRVKNLLENVHSDESSKIDTKPSTASIGGRRTMNENVNSSNRTEKKDPVLDRWQVLAGIKK